MNDNMEKWKDIQGYEGLYQVSNLGRVRTHINKITHSNLHGLRKWKQRILKFKGETPKTGYRVSLYREKMQKDFLVSRLVAFNFIGGDINDRWMTVNHKDGNRMNNHIDNLELVSIGDNIRHGFDNGLYTNQIKVSLKNIQTNEIIEFRSISQCSLFLKKCHAYISKRLKNKNKFINDEYEIIFDDR